MVIPTVVRLSLSGTFRGQTNREFLLENEKRGQLVAFLKSHGSAQKVRIALHNVNPNRKENTTVEKHCTSKPGKIIQLNESVVKNHLGQIIRRTIEQILTCGKS